MIENMFAFLRASTWDESKAIVLRHPELINDAGYGLLARVFSDPRMHPMIYPRMDPAKAAELIEFHRLLVKRCRESGISEAFDELESLNRWWNERNSR